MNKADSERLAERLSALGLERVERPEGADVVVVNSCSVRQSAEERAIGKMSFLKGLRRRRPHLLIALAGCMVPPDGHDLAERLPFVDFFLPPLQWEPLLRAVAERYPATMSTESEVSAGEQSCLRSGTDSGELGPSRWVPIITGCDNFCSDCIVPYRRGRERSRPVEEILGEVAELVAKGAREVTLLGQNVDSYGHDLPGRPDLAHLLERLHDIRDLWRIRFLTSHPKDMGDRLIDAVARLPKVCEHINLPVQAGDDRILGLMRRGYSVAHFRALVEKIRARVPGVALSTDLIVGFPGETAGEFENSLRLLADLRFDVVHVARYSPRPGTVASRLADDVPPDEKRHRLRLVEETQEEIARGRNAELVGREVEILVEACRHDKWEGRTRTDKLVFLPRQGDLLGKLVKVVVERSSAWSLQGKIGEGAGVGPSGEALAVSPRSDLD